MVRLPRSKFHKFKLYVKSVKGEARSMNETKDKINSKEGSNLCHVKELISKNNNADFIP